MEYLKNNTNITEITGVRTMIKICICGDTIKRPYNNALYCSDYCAAFETTKHEWKNMRYGGQPLNLKCFWCGDNFSITYGERNDKIFCNRNCSESAQKATNWLLFNCCRILARNKEGLGANAIARLLDEYGFHQTAHSIGSAMRKLVRLGIVARKDGGYKLVHPTACGKVWLLCL